MLNKTELTTNSIKRILLEEYQIYDECSIEIHDEGSAGIYLISINGKKEYVLK